MGLLHVLCLKTKFPDPNSARKYNNLVSTIGRIISQVFFTSDEKPDSGEILKIVLRKLTNGFLVSLRERKDEDWC